MSIIDLLISGFFIGIVILIWGSLIISHYFDTIEKTNTSKKSAFLLTIVDIIKIIFVVIILSVLFYYITEIF
jgi:type III secretory pathway component EscU